jgi:putative peptidoglycan lipid II flippase
VKVSVKLWTAAIISAGIAWGGRFALGPIHPIPMAIVVLGTYGVVYFGITTLLAIQESRIVTSRILGILGLNRG